MLSIKLNAVDLAFNNTAVLSALSLDITQQRVALIGRNGAGKSQLVRLIAGLIRPDRGTVQVNGVDVGRDRRAALQTVGILFQNPDHQLIFPTVMEELCFGIQQQGQTRAQAQDMAQAMLQRFACADWGPRVVHGLSQGQRHLVCLMAVLLMRPALILLDEPFAGLDMATTRRLGRYLEGLDQALLHVTHDLAAIAGYERVIWLDRGQVLADGPPDTVLPLFRAHMMALGDGDAVAEL
jgi:biotin transport system ATP-binding protein